MFNKSSVFVFYIFSSACVQLQCFKNCSIVNEFEGEIYTVYYSVRNKQCKNISTPENVLPSDPIQANKDTEPVLWYLYNDSRDGRYQKIALNFSWSPREYGSIKFLRGYHIEIWNDNELIRKHIYFCFLNQLNFYNGINAIFFYDLFGYNDHWNLRPDQKWRVQITSLPKKPFLAPFLVIHIDIPNCSNSALAKVFSCKRQQKKITLSFVKCNCSKQPSAIIRYSVPRSYGKYTFLSLKKIFPSGLSNTIDTWTAQPLQGDFMVTLPLNSDLTAEYFLVVWGNIKATVRRNVFFNCTECKAEETTFSTDSYQIIIVTVSVVVMAILILILVGIKCILKDSKHLQGTLFSKPECCENRLPVDEINLEKETVSEKSSSRHIKVYVIFFEDHPKHTEVVVKFVNYLIGDLAFDIVFQLYETKQVCIDSISWMMKSLVKSDKVIIIWSPGAAKRWYSSEKLSASGNDFFTPVLKKIYDDLFLKKNVLKYIFVYFSYVSKDDIPAEFIESYPHLHFKLMQQLTDFYFRLIGQERFLPGAVVQEKKADGETYFDENLTGNRYGHTLLCEIKEMIAYTKNNPDWYVQDERMLKKNDNWYVKEEQ